MKRTIFVVLTALILSATVRGQTVPRDAKMPASPNDLPQTPGANPRELSGFWELRDIRGYRGNRNQKVELTPEAQAAAKQAALERQRETNDPNVRVIVPTPSRYCEPMGMPFMMTQSPPINIVQGKDEIDIFSEQHGSPRHIYIDGRTLPPLGDLPYTTNGNSVGHWEGDTLVVETTGFTDKYGMRNLPGGVQVNPKSHLVERFHLIDDGKMLAYEATWTDPGLYVQPVTSRYYYFRDEPDEFAIDETCDAGDSLQGQSAVPPPQNPSQKGSKY